MTQLTESGKLTRDGNRWKILAITPGKGSSGTYPQETLEAAGRERVFPAGTLMFVNHATESQDMARPEGAIQDLAGVLTEDAHWDDAAGGLAAEAKIFDHWRPTLESMRDDIGVSIRASGEVEESADGRIVKRLVEGRSIDFVTQAGRGGRVLEVLESARPSTLTEIVEIFTPQTPPGPAAEEHHTTDRKEAAMAETPKENDGRVAEADSELERLRKENAELKAEIAKLKAEKAKEARTAHVAGLVDEAFKDIDGQKILKGLLVESLADTEATDEQITAKATEAAAELPAPTGNGVTGLGESAPPTTTPKTITDDDIVGALKGR